jgi:hypothetical protein
MGIRKAEKRYAVKSSVFNLLPRGSEILNTSKTLPANISGQVRNYSPPLKRRLTFQRALVTFVPVSKKQGAAFRRTRFFDWLAVWKWRRKICLGLEITIFHPIQNDQEEIKCLLDNACYIADKSNVNFTILVKLEFNKSCAQNAQRERVYPMTQVNTTLTETPQDVSEVETDLTKKRGRVVQGAEKFPVAIVLTGNFGRRSARSVIEAHETLGNLKDGKVHVYILDLDAKGLRDSFPEYFTNQGAPKKKYKKGVTIMPLGKSPNGAGGKEEFALKALQESNKEISALIRGWKKKGTWVFPVSAFGGGGGIVASNLAQRCHRAFPKKGDPDYQTGGFVLSMAIMPDGKKSGPRAIDNAGKALRTLWPQPQTLSVAQTQNGTGDKQKAAEEDRPVPALIYFNHRANIEGASNLSRNKLFERINEEKILPALMACIAALQKNYSVQALDGQDIKTWCEEHPWIYASSITLGNEPAELTKDSNMDGKKILERLLSDPMQDCPAIQVCAVNGIIAADGDPRLLLDGLITDITTGLHTKTQGDKTSVKEAVHEVKPPPEDQESPDKKEQGIIPTTFTVFLAAPLPHLEGEQAKYPQIEALCPQTQQQTEQTDEKAAAANGHAPNGHDDQPAEPAPTTAAEPHSKPEIGPDQLVLLLKDPTNKQSSEVIISGMNHQMVAKCRRLGELVEQGIS